MDTEDVSGGSCPGAAGVLRTPLNGFKPAIVAVSIVLRH